MSNICKSPYCAPLVLLQQWYRRICDLQTVKCSGKIKVHIDLSAAGEEGRIVICHRHSGRTLQLLCIGEQWLLSAWEESHMTWQLSHSLPGNAMLALVDQTIQTYLAAQPPTRYSAPPPAGFSQSPTEQTIRPLVS
jgi:hypothetical protein